MLEESSDIGAMKGRINEKLKKEAGNLNLLRETLNKSDTNTQSMLFILTSFDNRLKRLNDTIVPVYQETENLRRRQENIEKTISSLDQVLSHYHVASEVNNVLKDGPSLCGLDIYLKIMDRIVKAVHYFTNTNPACPEIAAVTILFDDGCESLHEQFKLLLDRHGKPVSSVTILNVVTEFETGVDSPPTSHLQQLPQHVIQDLHNIAHWLFVNTASTDFLQIYMSSRSFVLVKSLQGLKEHTKTTSIGSTSSHSHSSPLLGTKFRGNKDTPTRRSFNKKIGLVRNATKNLIKSPFETGYKRQASSSLETMKEEGAEVDIDDYLTKVTALLHLIQSELHLITVIIPEKHQRIVFDNIIQQAMDIIVLEAEQIATNARSAVARRDYGLVLSLFPVIKHLRAIKPAFDLTLEGCQAPTRAKLASLLSTLNSTGAKALEEFIEYIRNDPDKSYNMPRDGTVHELTNHTIIFMENILEYLETSGMMLLMHADPTGSSGHRDPEKAKMKLAEYMTRVLSSLGLNLSNKAESYSDVTLRSVFMLNNYNYILKSLVKTGLLSVIVCFNEDVQKYYSDQIAEQKRLYAHSWTRVLQHIQEVNKPLSLDNRASAPELVKLKDKERQQIKDKFSGFNKELEELFRIQKGYAIPDIELKEAVKAENKRFILPKYQQFRDKYTRYHFTRNSDKYIKYSVDSVGHMLERFFDATA